MTSRERIRNIIAGRPTDRCGFWLGNPHPDTWPIYHRYFGTRTEEELRLKLGDDFRWLPVWGYHDRSGRGLFPISNEAAAGGPLAECRDVRQIDEHAWPKLEYVDFEPAMRALENAGEFYRASGMWTCFYHNVMDLFGTESYLANMYENPDIVQAVTDRVCQFYYDANEIFFKRAGRLIDGFFFGNDFGTQLDLICGPKQFDAFVMPWLKQFTSQGHRHGYQVILHSCGSIYRVIGRLIEVGIDCLHPLQARARQMDAETLARDFAGKIAFLGGVDTQQLLVQGTPGEIKVDVRRLKQLLGPRLIVSPSHEALLPNVPPENVAAMAEAALE
ncbi:MAG: uroporphyrinogen decarboxylase family protein [Bacillota bacterium]